MFPLQDLRLQRLFGGNMNMGPTPPMPTIQGPYNPIGVETFQPPTPPSPVAPTGPEQGGYDVDARMAELFNPSTVSIDRFNEMTGKYPQYEEPGMLKKIGAAALGTVGDLYGPQGAGKTAFSEMMGYGKHGRAVQDWENQVQPLERAANIERQSNTNQRTAANQTISAELRQQAQDARIANDERRAEIAQQRADVYQWKSMNPNLQFDFSGPNVMVTNPQTGEVITTNIPTGNLTDMDRMNLQHRQAMTEIGARGDETRTTQAAGHQQELDEIGARGDEARETRQTPTPGQSVDVDSPNEARQRRLNNANQLINARPELREFIEITPDGDVKIMEHTPAGPGFMGFGGEAKGPTPEQYNEIYQAIFGQGRAAPASGGNPTSGSPVRGMGPGPGATNRPGQQVMQKMQRNPQTGAVRTVYSYDGGKTWTTQGGGG